MEEKLKVKDDIIARLSPTPHVIYGDGLIKSSRSWKMRCPFHEEKTASFHIYTDSLSFKCFGCGEHGTVFDFVMRKEKLEFKEALKSLADKAGITLSASGYKDRYSRLYAAGLEAQKFYSGLLATDKKVNDYLKERGLTDESITKFHIGSIPSGKSVIPHLQGKGFTEAEMIEAGLAHKKDRRLIDSFFNRIMFPIVSSKRVVGFSGRDINGSKEYKYMNTAATPIFKKSDLLYGYNSFDVQDKGYCIAVEGNVDTVLCHQHGFTNTAAPLGSSFSEAQMIRIGKDTDTVILLFDGDEPGIKAAGKAAKILFEMHYKGGVVTLPEGEDPASFLQKDGDLQVLLDHPVPFAVYIARNFPSWRSWILNQMMYRGRYERAEFFASEGTTDEINALRNFSGLSVLDDPTVIKKMSPVAKKNDVEIRRMGDRLLLYSKGKYFYDDMLKGKADFMVQADEMLKEFLTARGKGIKNRKKQ